MSVSGRWPRPRLGDKFGWSWRNAEESFSKPLPPGLTVFLQKYLRIIVHQSIT